MNAAKFFICLASFLAFSVTFFTGMMTGSDFIPIIRDAAIACLIAAFVTRFFVQIIINAVREAHIDHMNEVAESEDSGAAADQPSGAKARAVSKAQEPVTQ